VPGSGITKVVSSGFFSADYESGRKNCQACQDSEKIAVKYVKNIIFDVFASVISFNKDIIQSCERAKESF